MFIAHNPGFQTCTNKSRIHISAYVTSKQPDQLRIYASEITQSEGDVFNGYFCTALGRPGLDF